MNITIIVNRLHIIFLKFLFLSFAFMTELEITQSASKRKPIITSGSLAGILAILGISGLVRDIIIIRLALEPGEFGDYRIPTVFAVYAAFRILIETLYVYMYFDYKRTRIHRVLWLGIAVYEVGVFIYSTTSIKEYGPLSIPGLLTVIAGVGVAIWGFILANNASEYTMKEAGSDHGNHRVLQRYLRPGLSAPGLSVALVAGLLSSFVYTFYKYFFSRWSLALPNEILDNKWFVNYYVAGVILLVVFSVIIFIKQRNYQFQRLAWIGCILASVLMFMESLDFFMNPSPFSLGDPLLPLTVMFLCVRGYCLVHVDEAINARSADEPVEDEFGLPVKKFYFLKPSGAMTSSRWALVGIILYVPVIYGVFAQMASPFRDKDMVALAIAAPFMFTIISFMRIYHSPATPWRHKGWWWYTFAFNAIIAILSLGSLASNRPQTVLLILTSILTIISLIGLNRLHLDEPYERRLA